MPRDEFQWGAVPQPLLRRLARHLGLPGDAAGALAEAYGRRPKAGFVRAAWPALRDGWLAKDAAARERVVRELRARGAGDGSLPVRSRAQQLAYLASCRNGAPLRAVVLAAFLDLGAGPDGFEAGMDAAWAEFAGLLEAALRELGDGSVAVTLPAPDGGAACPEIVFTRAGATLGCPYDAAQRDVLRDLGWAPAPDDGRLVLAPGQRPAALAAAAVVTMREAFGVVHPAFLLPTVGEVRGAEQLESLVDGALAPLLCGRRERDGDGDIPVDLGSATAYVRVQLDSPFVTVFAPLLYDVPGDGLVLERLNQLNRTFRAVRFTWAAGVVTATVDVWCVPFVPDLVRHAVTTLAEVAGQSEALRLRVGGQVYGPVDDE